MRPKRRWYIKGGCKVRPIDYEDVSKVRAGTMRSLAKKGYQWPVRTLGGSKSSDRVTLPLQVVEYWKLVKSDWIEFLSTHWEGLIVIRKLTVEQGAFLDDGGRREFDGIVSKVQAPRGSLSVNVPKRILELLGAKRGDALLFASTDCQDVISVSVIRVGRNSEGANRET